MGAIDRHACVGRHAGTPRQVTSAPGNTASAVLVERAVDLPPELGSAASARRVLREALEAAGRYEWVDDGAIAISEVVTNAVLHAHTAIRVLVEVRADRALVEVRDRNRVLPLQRGYDQQATTGRGMALVAALASECGVRNLGDEGKSVWFTLRRSVADPSVEDLLAIWGLEGGAEPLDSSPGGPVTVPVAPETRAVVLLSMPATLWLAARQHHDALLRELVLYQAEHDDIAVDLAAADEAGDVLFGALLQAVREAEQAGTSESALPARDPSPLPLVPMGLDLTVVVPARLGASFAALQDALDAGERLAARGLLLVRPGLPEVVAVRDWACEQVVAQLAGVAPAAWAGAALEHFETAGADAGELASRLGSARAGAAQWDAVSVREADRSVVAADEGNRIIAVSRAFADLVRWQPDELVGRRVVTLIPARLREAHVAGFTRHLTTGEAHVLGVPLVLPVLRSDGSELECHVFIERAAVAGSAVYVAEMEPTEPFA